MGTSCTEGVKEQTRQACRTKHIETLTNENYKLRAELAKHCWIPVSERLPKDEDNILAFGKDGYGYKIVCNTSYNLDFNKFRILSDVTHWKPIILPKG